MYKEPSSKPVSDIAVVINTNLVSDAVFSAT